MHKAIGTHKSTFPEPISLKKNECFQLSGKSDNWDGHIWLWAKATNDNQGWIPDCLVEIHENQTRAAFDYNAHELDAELDQIFEIEESINGWAWCKNKHGNYGWLPNKLLIADKKSKSPVRRITDEHS